MFVNQIDSVNVQLIPEKMYHYRYGFKLFSNKNIAFIAGLTLLCKDFQTDTVHDTKSKNLHAAYGHDCR